MAKKEIDLSIIIISYNTEKLTLSCIKSVQKFSPKKYSYEIVVVDNDSKDQTVEKINNLKINNLTLIQSKTNLGFSGGNRLAIEKTNSKYVLLLNSDTKITQPVFDEMVEYMESNQLIGISSCGLKNSDGSNQVSGGYFPNIFRVFLWMTAIQRLPFMDNIFKPFHPKYAFDSDRNVDWVTGAFFLIRRETIEKIGNFDKDYFMYTEEVDFCFRAKKAGYEVKILPSINIIHYGGASSTQEFAIISEYKGIKTFYKKHYPSWQMPILRTFLFIGTLIRYLFVSNKTYGKALSQI